ncbi:sprouty-related, EVH1 domain-containing protein 1 [Condylostylus longicornis]|uniref:sprouty-related, EVH1 domain-containing protein 1 n=1 Tax=Condylostylus longicornis TaxID=2530218 RepID=UPI00244E1C70|nr:sprouty-related, EVH1 domain-containing protein 1 [Condylostylus longicornis]
MTEGHESDYLVRVRAQVMTRDESTEGWLPLAGGGLANVSIRKRARLPPGTGGHEYIIYGQRISDQNVILSCVINRDLKYFKVMPTFHHWRAGKQRNGLTFQTAADARAFDKGIVRAYNDLIDGLTRNNNKSQKWPQIPKYDSVGEDDVFMTLDLPLEPSENQSSPEGSGSHKSENNKEKQPNIHYISCDKPQVPLPPSPNGEHQQTTIAPGDNYSYVQLTAVHDYNYPVVDEPVAAVVTARRDSTCSLKKRTALECTTPGSIIEPVSILKDPLSGSAGGVGGSIGGGGSGSGLLIKNRVRCRFCHEFYTEEWNRRGACEFAPDYFKSGLECISGMGCARCMLYHCMSDSEGETPQHPCECVNENGCTKRWVGLALLSLIVPCLWCYPPLKTCHWIGVSCGICGGKHKPQV